MGWARSLVGMLTKLNFGEFRSSIVENRGSKLRMATRRYCAFPVYRTARFKVWKRERSMPWLADPGDSMIAEAASLPDGRLGKLAGKVEMRLVDPLDFRGRSIAGLHQEEVGAFPRAVDRQPAFRQEAMPDHGQQREQDADQQDG